MNNYYLISIGGTGARVVKALVYMCAAQCFPKISFKILCIDSDENNGDLKELQNLGKIYNELKKYGFEEVLPEIKYAGKDGLWSPLESINESMSDMISASRMSDDAKEVFEFLYSDAERNKKLEGGFYGHTSIGSYFMAQQVKKDEEYTDVWRDFFDEKAAGKVFIIGSVFGGTGASGVPTIARIIRETSLTESLNIGALFMMPYFKPKKEEDNLQELGIDWTTFTTKTKMALSYYKDQEFNKIFNTMYFIGENPADFMLVPNNDHGKSQNNKSHVIEVFAATAVMDFFNSDADEFKTKVLKREDVLDGKLLNETLKNYNVFDSLIKFFGFSVLYNKYLYHCFQDGYAKEQWLKGYKDLSKDGLEILHELCTSYVGWMRELIMTTDNEGKMSLDEYDNNLQWIRCGTSDAIFTNESLSYSRHGLIGKNKKAYNLNELDCFEVLVNKSKGKTLNTAYDIIEKLTNVKTKRTNNDDISVFVSDVLGCVLKEGSTNV